jgi:hypothetical protein
MHPMVAAHPLPPSSSAAVALRKIANGEPLTDEEAKLVDATMPKLTEDDLRADADVDPELELAYLAGEIAEDPCRSASY